MFKIGDHVVGKENNGYSATNNECLLEVTEYYDTSDTFDAKILGHIQNKFRKNSGMTAYSLAADAFVIATPAQEEMIMNAGKKIPKEKALEHINLPSGLEISVYENDRIESTFNPDRSNMVEIDEERRNALKKLLSECKKVMDPKKKTDGTNINVLGIVDQDPETYKVFDNIFSKSAMTDAVRKLIDFFVEFQFEPNFRFVNTLALKASSSIPEAKEYVQNYFKLTNSPFAEAIEGKIKSEEFKGIISALCLCNPNNVINKRFKVYYGSQGTGKTTKAMEETSGRCVICNNSMLPQDLIEDFDFDDGKAGFKPSILVKCMEEGKSIVLDEINLLPFETIRFLQGILDDKKQFIYKGKTIHINDGFNIIGTMNLVVNGMAFGLPEPLVDRCSSIEKSELTAETLVSAIR